MGADEAAAASGIAVLLLAGCAVGGFSEATTYKCLDHDIEAAVLNAATPVSELTGEAATMVAEAQNDLGEPLKLDPDAGWVLAGQGDESLLIIRPFAAGEVVDGGPPNSDHEIIEISRLHGTNTDPNAWYITANSVCPLTIDLGGLSVPSVALDPAHLPDAASTDVQLLVTERECNSGQTADGRVKLVSLVETEESVTVTVGVKPRGGDQTCPSNPATPYTVKLAAPLGERTLIDGTRGVPIAVP